MTSAARFAAVLSLVVPSVLPGQNLSTATSDSAVAVRVVVRQDTTLLEGVTVRGGDTELTTDSEGAVLFRLAPGEHSLIARKIGFRPDSLRVMVAGVDTTVAIALEKQVVELSGVVVSATRSGKRIEDEPLRVEVLGEEEVEEKLLMTPGDITMMLNESSGLRVQSTSPSLGGAAVRIQGLRGRYTQILADGLPLYGGQTGGLGLLQIPPMDLGGVEIIKGVASALYGGSALGGVINLISRRPEEERVTDLLLNQTTLGGSDVVGFASAQVTGQWGYSLLAGGHRQSRIDRDDDGWTDLPGYTRAVVRPRAFWSSPGGHSVMLTAGSTIERREGGTNEGATVPSGEPFAENLRTNRYDGGLVGGFLIGESTILSVRGAAATQIHRHTFGGVSERDRHVTWLAETSLTIPQGASLWVVGAALQQEQYRAEDISGFDYRFTTPGFFAQNTISLSSALSLTASARIDHHSEYGMQLAPRVSALLRLGPTWTLRASGGGGYFAPSPFTEETEVIGLTPVQRLQGIREERARSASIDLGGSVGVVELNATIFGSVVHHPIGVRAVAGAPGRVELLNLGSPTRTSGGELLMRWNPEPFHLTGSYTFVRSTEQDPESGVRRRAPLTPGHQAGLVTMWEQEGRSRAGVELYYTGSQTLDDNPYRELSRPYLHIGILGERRFGSLRPFINVENLLGFRQTQYDPLVLPTRGLGGRWTTDVWGPLEGRIANVGIRFRL